MRVRVVAMLLVAAAAAAVSLATRDTRAQVIPVSCGCSTDPTTDLGACLGDIAALPPDPLIPNRIVNDIFMTSDGHDARTLTFGTYYRGLTAASAPPLAGCIGVSTNAYDRDSCPGCNCPTCTPTVCTSYLCSTCYDHTDNSLAHQYADFLDWKWTQVYRGTFESGWITPVADQVHDCADINDTANCSYNPVYGLVMDLGGEANRVAIFAVTDHTDNCLETFEWSVWLTDNPNATTTVPDGSPPDPQSWNRAVLDQIFLQGWTRNPASLGLPTDTSDLHDMSAGDAVSDSPTVVFSLPCGETFRYASVVGGNFGNPGPHCQFDSDEDEVDAVAGLNEDNTSLCPDADGDGYRAASCGGSDCNDSDPTVHPGAIETCASGSDLNCDGIVDSCPTGTACFQNLCVPECVEGACAQGFTCTTGSGGQQFCVPNACVGVSCAAGQICGPAGCQDPCSAAVCPVGQVCLGGGCVDPCQGFECPLHQHCAADSSGTPHCAVDCSCAPCSAPLVCSSTSGQCTSSTCDTISCAPGTVKDCSGAMPVCVTYCSSVTCPLGQYCDPTSGNCLVDYCFGIACPSGTQCVMGSCVVTPRDGGASDGGGMVDARLSDANGDVGSHGAMDASFSGDTRSGEGGEGGTQVVRTPGCGCRTTGDRSSPWPSVLAVALALAVVVQRRRRVA